MNEKKIEEVAEKYANDITQHNNGWDWYDHAEEGFKAGAHWAIEQFLKDLWHDVDEMPQKAKTFIFECSSTGSLHYHIGMMFNPNDYEKNAETWQMNRWCYLDDLLPKQKGGRK